MKRNVSMIKLMSLRMNVKCQEKSRGDDRESEMYIIIKLEVVIVVVVVVVMQNS